MLLYLVGVAGIEPALVLSVRFTVWWGTYTQRPQKRPYLVAKAGLEPATVPLSGEYSTSELLSYNLWHSINWMPFSFWWIGKDSNLRSSRVRFTVWWVWPLPNLSVFFNLVAESGFEPLTSELSALRSYQLNYSAIFGGSVWTWTRNRQIIGLMLYQLSYTTF